MIETGLDVEETGDGKGDGGVGECCLGVVPPPGVVGSVVTLEGGGGRSVRGVTNPGPLRKRCHECDKLVSCLHRRLVLGSEHSLKLSILLGLYSSPLLLEYVLLMLNHSLVFLCGLEGSKPGLN